MDNIKTALDFGGFYNSLHDDQVSEAVAVVCGADDPETGEFIGNDEFDDYNEWQAANLKYSREYVEKLNNELETNIKFLELDSPREYNFKTDVIICEVSRKDVSKIFRYIKENGLKSDVFEWLRGMTTSRDGFHSFYDYADMFKQENRYFLIESFLAVVIQSLGESYPFYCDEFYI